MNNSAEPWWPSGLACQSMARSNARGQGFEPGLWRLFFVNNGKVQARTTLRGNGTCLFYICQQPQLSELLLKIDILGERRVCVWRRVIPTSLCMQRSIRIRMHRPRKKYIFRVDYMHEPDAWLCKETWNGTTEQLQKKVAWCPNLQLDT